MFLHRFPYKTLVNRGSTAGFVSPSVYIGFRLFVLAKRQEGRLSPGRIDPSASASPRRPPRPAAPPCAAPPRPACGVSGLWIRQMRQIVCRQNPGTRRAIGKVLQAIDERLISRLLCAIFGSTFAYKNGKERVLCFSE